MSDHDTWDRGYAAGRAAERRNWTLDGSTHYDGCEAYHPRCEARMLRSVLVNLIAELRSEAETCTYSERLPWYVIEIVDSADVSLSLIKGHSDA